MNNEDFLQYIWQYQLFDRTNLSTSSGSSLSILKPGILNTHAGPDFENSRIIIEDIEWFGKTEVHINASDWLKHKHQEDKAYENVVLHVVWKNDKDIYRQDGTLIPTLVLKDRINQETLKKYTFLKETKNQIPCESFFRFQSSLAKISMMEKALSKRLERKAHDIIKLYNTLNNDFEETTYQTLLKNFGFKLNAETFFSLAQNLPLKILRKHKDNSLQLEALLFGQAGFLENPETEYPKKLAKEYDFLAHKYSLKSYKLERSSWKFLRTRPQNFPTVRLAQIAALLHKTPNLFSIFINQQDNIKEILAPQVSEYWQQHYYWDKKSTIKNSLGQNSLENILINTVAPLLAAYYYITDDRIYFDKALSILESLKAERNFITRIWDSVEQKSKSAFDSQALIEQYNEFCSFKRCLACPVGSEILKH